MDRRAGRTRIRDGDGTRRADASAEEIRSHRDAAAAADVTIVDVGAWENNPISDDPAERRAAVDACARRFELADARQGEW